MRRVMRLIRLVVIYRAPNTSKKDLGHKVWLNLLKGIVIERYWRPINYEYFYLYAFEMGSLGIGNWITYYN